MKQKELREKMPEIAAWVDQMVDAFGKDCVHGQIRRGLAGEPTFFAQENGHAVGTPVGQGVRYQVRWNEQGISEVVNDWEQRHG